MWGKKEKKEPSPEVTVFKIKHSDIPKGRTQCAEGKHAWVKMNEEEIYCPLCQTGAIVNPEILEQYL